MLSDFRNLGEFRTDCDFGVTGAIIASALIGAATTATVAGIQSHQTSKAVDAQQQAGQQAIQQLKPYADTGTKAFQTLGSLMGLGGGGGGQLPGPTPLAPTSGGVTRPSPNMGAISDPNKNGGWAGQAPGTATLSSTSSYANPSAPGYAPTSQPAPMMRVQGPDGQVYIIPAQETANASRNGGKVLGPA